MSNYEEHAKQEFKAAGWTDKNGQFKDEMQELLCSQVLELLALFATHGHSGTTAPYAVSLFSKLADFQPLVPITGEDLEWIQVGENLWQNKRCSRVFKELDAYDSRGKVFREPSGACYTNQNSRVTITFPYTPTTVYIDVPD